MTRVTEIADYLLGSSLDDDEVREALATRWPDVSQTDLAAAYLLATVQTATQVVDAMSATLEAPEPAAGNQA